MDDEREAPTESAARDADADEKRREKREEVRERVAPRRADYEPEGTDPRTGAWPTLKKTALEFSEDNMTDWAAALTYYGLLSLFPALIALVSIVGLFGDPETTTRALTDIVTQIGPQSAADTFSGPIESITSNRRRRRGRCSSSASARRSGRPRATSAPSCAPRTSSTRRPRGARSGSCARCRSASRW